MGRPGSAVTWPTVRREYKLLRMTRPFTIASAALLALPLVASPQGPDAASLRGQVRHYRTAHDVQILHELAELLAIPNVASDSANIRANARHLVGLLERRGVRARLLESPGSPPAVYGELNTAGATRTVVFYAHYDGQPVTPEDWTTPPWRPVLRDRALADGGREIPFPTAPGTVQGESRIYARSASDDKSPIVAMLRAIDALRAARLPLSVNLKFFLEGEEEAGSPHLREMLSRYADLLRADVWLFGDGPVHQSRRQQVVFGVRGVVGAELTVYGPRRALHSGHYGNWAPNPAAMIATLIASMRASDGRVTIAGFYDDVVPISAGDRDALRRAPPVDEALRRELLLGSTEGGDVTVGERVMLPALNVRGLRSGAVGAAAANAVPAEARASLDFRLVANQRVERVRALVEAHARAQGYYVLHGEPTAEQRLGNARVLRIDWDPGGYPATRTSMTLPVSRAVMRAVEEAVGGPVAMVPTLGGSLPTYLFAEVLRAPLIVLPIVNHDNSQHAADENLRLQNLFDGIEVYAGVLARLGYVWDRDAGVKF
jgi:acetylornithine deacetylase/succinyl-diaminopimelate desuccinylase-like protein